MQARPIRSQIYLPVLRFGITDEDWGFVILASIAGYAVPFLLGWKYKQVPLELVGWLVLMGSSILALNLLRRHNRPAWLKHVLQAALAGRVQRRWLPREYSPAWLLPMEES
jgi:hypothetical protein